MDSLTPFSRYWYIWHWQFLTKFFRIKVFGIWNDSVLQVFTLGKFRVVLLPLLELWDHYHTPKLSHIRFKSEEIKEEWGSPRREQFFNASNTNRAMVATEKNFPNASLFWFSFKLTNPIPGAKIGNQLNLIFINRWGKWDVEMRGDILLLNVWSI